jgi:hypothetical protein
VSSIIRADKWQNALGVAYNAVLQVVSTTKTDTFTTTSTTYGDITGLTATITPKFSNSKILVLAQISVSGKNNLGVGAFRLNGGNSSTYVGAASGTTVQGVFGGLTTPNLASVIFSQSIVYLDSPATTSATTYAVQARSGTGDSLFVNRSDTEADGAKNVRGASSITVIEIAQ